MSGNTDKLIGDALDQDMPGDVFWSGIASIVLGLLGGIVGAYAGFTQGDGMITIMGAATGFFMVTCLCCVCGPVGKYYFGWVYVSCTPPEWQRFQNTGFSTWDLYVTVHRCQNALNPRPNFYGLLVPSFMLPGPHLFAQVKVGRELREDQFLLRSNPAKTTCTSRDQVFEEVFHFIVTPTDDTMRVVVWDQNTFTKRRVGSVDINITKEILEAGFPQNKGFRLLRSSHTEDDDTDDEEQQVDYRDIGGSIVLSFKPGPNFPQYANAKYRANQPYEHLAVYMSNSELVKGVNTNFANYGTWATNVNGYHTPS